MALNPFRLMTVEEAREILAAADKSSESYPARVKATRLLAMQLVSPKERAELAAYNAARADAIEDAKWGTP